MNFLRHFFCITVMGLLLCKASFAVEPLCIAELVAQANFDEWAVGDRWKTIGGQLRRSGLLTLSPLALLDSRLKEASKDSMVARLNLLSTCVPAVVYVAWMGRVCQTLAESYGVPDLAPLLFDALMEGSKEEPRPRDQFPRSPLSLGSFWTEMHLAAMVESLPGAGASMFDRMRWFAGPKTPGDRKKLEDKTRTAHENTAEDFLVRVLKQMRDQLESSSLETYWANSIAWLHKTANQTTFPAFLMVGPVTASRAILSGFLTHTVSLDGGNATIPVAGVLGVPESARAKLLTDLYQILTAIEAVPRPPPPPSPVDAMQEMLRQIRKPKQD